MPSEATSLRFSSLLYCPSSCPVRVLIISYSPLFSYPSTNGLQVLIIPPPLCLCPFLSDHDQTIVNNSCNKLLLASFSPSIMSSKILTLFSCWWSFWHHFLHPPSSLFHKVLMGVIVPMLQTYMLLIQTDRKCFFQNCKCLSHFCPNLFLLNPIQINI